MLLQLKLFLPFFSVEMARCVQHTNANDPLFHPAGEQQEFFFPELFPSSLLFGGGFLLG